jgi:hypothetical protein
MFLDEIGEERAKIVNKAIIQFAEGKEDLDPKDCIHVANRVKIGILDANVVVYFDDKENDLEFIGGMEWITNRAS